MAKTKAKKRNKADKTNQKFDAENQISYENEYHPPQRLLGFTNEEFTPNAIPAPLKEPRVEDERNYEVELRSGYKIMLNQAPLPNGFDDYKAELQLSFHGTQLLKNDYDVLKGLEIALGKPIPRVGKINWDSFGFIPMYNRVVQLGLYGSPVIQSRDLMNTRGLRIIPDVIGQLKYLQLLALNHNQLKELPEGIFSLKNLHTLFLTGNNLKRISDRLGDLTSLHILLLNENQLEMLPESIGKLKHLQKLYLEKNQLKSLPESIGNLRSLKELYLFDNKVVSLPESIGNLRSLKILDLEKNKLSKLPRSINSLQDLHFISIYDNPLEIQPKSIGFFWNYHGDLLKKPDYFVLQALERQIGQPIPRIKKMEWNSFGYIQNEGRVKELGLYETNLNALPESIGDLSALAFLSLLNTPLVLFPKSFKTLSALRTLLIEPNRLNALRETDQKTMKLLQEQGCRIQHIQRFKFPNFDLY